MAIFYGDGSNSNTGRIVKVSTNSYRFNFTTSSGSYVENGMNIDFACTDSNNRILILITCALDGQSSQCFMTIYKDGSNMLQFEGFGASQSSARSLSAAQITIVPGDTNSHAYRVRIRKGSGSGSVEGPPWSTGHQSITVLEIAD
tara:strand:- start:1470 stop:1904 length:435 start_codon:yes stop_codon:yes gene_type:complete